MLGLREPSLVQATRAHRGEVTCADLFGAWLVAGGGCGALRLWRWAGGAGWQPAQHQPKAHRYGVTAARWSAAGVLLASAGVDGAVRLWAGRALAPRRSLVAPRATAVRALCWAGGVAAGGRLLAGHDDGALCVWDARRGLLLTTLAAHEGALHAICSPARGALLLTACTHGVLKVFDLVALCRDTATEQAAVAPLTWVDCVHDLGALCADVSEDGELVATGGHDAVVRVWRVQRQEGAGGAGGAGAAGGVRECGPPLLGHAAAVTALRWASASAPAPALLASASLDRTARLWSSFSGECLHVIPAHSRYLTCVAIAHDLLCMVTGSNDKSVRTWSLGAFTIDDELEPPCAVSAHFALGDLVGIGPVDAEELAEAEGAGEGGRGAAERQGGARDAWRVWAEARAHQGAINRIAVHRECLATASSDGTVRVWRWENAGGDAEAGGALVLVHSLSAHEYPALAADFGSEGRLLLTAGLDGTAFLWDVESGVQLRSLCVPSVSGAGGDTTGAASGEVGGGGVRDARLSAHRPPLALLATDDGLAPLWDLANTHPKQQHVYAGFAEAATSCAWAGAGLGAVGGAAGELRLLAPPPRPRILAHCSPAHDQGVLSCEFAPRCGALALPGGSHLLATAGCDSLVKLWLVQTELLDDVVESASMRTVRQWEAHGGPVNCVRWQGEGEGEGEGDGDGLLLASAGGDRWARVWRVRRTGSAAGAQGGFAAALVAAVPAGGAAEALAAAPLLRGALLAVGGATGGLALWRLPCPVDRLDEDQDDGDDEGAVPRFWSERTVARWLREYVSRAPGSNMSREEELAIVARARNAGVTGSRLLDDPIEELVEIFGYDTNDDPDDEKSRLDRAATRSLIISELNWLRRRPPPPEVTGAAGAAGGAAHGLLCPLSHRLLREPVRAADGFSYDRASFLEWLLAAEGAGALTSPMSGRRLRSRQLRPNHGLRHALRLFLQQHDAHALTHT